MEEKRDESVIQVIGVGGGGNNAVNHMYHSGVKNVSFVVCNTDYHALDRSPVSDTVQLGPQLTEGLGAGCVPHKGELAAVESIEAIRSSFYPKTKMVFIAAGMGGGTGTGASPIIAQEASNLGLLTVAVVTTPFKAEGRKKLAFAQEGIKNVMQYADAVILIDNNKIVQEFGDMTFTRAFAKVDDVLLKAVKGVSDIITYPGYVGVDFEDVNTVLKKSGLVMMTTGAASGSNRSIEAVQNALESPLLSGVKTEGVKTILLNVTSRSNNEITLQEFDDLQGYLKQKTHHEADIIFGLVYDDELEEELHVTILLAGLGGGISKVMC